MPKSKKTVTSVNSTTKAKRKDAVKEPVVLSAVIPESKPVKKYRFPKTFWILLILIILGGLLYLGRGLFVAALVNGRPISRVEVIKQLEKNGGKQALDNLVTKELILQEARKQNVVIADDEVQKEIDNLSKNVSAQGTTLDAALSQQGMTRTDLQENIRMQKTVEKLLSTQLAVSDDDVKKYFDANKDSYGKNAKYDDLKETIRKELEQEKFSTAFQDWYKKLQSQSDIKFFVSY